MTDRYESRASTHADDCWSWGPAHYECAVGKIERMRAENERLRAEVAEWKRVAAAQAELHGEAEARADKLAEALRDAREALADAANTMYAIFGESQFCYSCSAFERANQWRQDWHGGDPLLQQITDALEQESNDA